MLLPLREGGIYVYCFEAMNEMAEFYSLNAL